MILVFGSINLDLVARVRAIPRPGETVLSERYDLSFGGKGANQAVAAARARKDTALAVRMASAVGEDDFGRSALDNLARNGVDIAAVRAVGLPTGCAFITVSAAGENAITVASGANRAVSGAALPDALLEGVRVLVLQMEVPPAEALAVARRARARGARVLLNLAPAPGEAEAALLPALLAETDLLVANEHEALTALALLGEAETEPEAAMRRLATRCGEAGIVTLGRAGALAFTAAGEVLRAAALPVEAVDTTGAGDTFMGILAAALAEGMALAPALSRACAGASMACLYPGAQAGMPNAAALDAAG